MTFTQHVNLIAWSCYSQLLVLPSAASVEPHVPQIRLSMMEDSAFPAVGPSFWNDLALDLHELLAIGPPENILHVS